MVLQTMQINRFIISFNRTVLVLLYTINTQEGHLIPTTDIVSLFKRVK